MKKPNTPKKVRVVSTRKHLEHAQPAHLDPFVHSNNDSPPVFAVCLFVFLIEGRFWTIAHIRVYISKQLENSYISLTNSASLLPSHCGIMSPLMGKHGLCVPGREKQPPIQTQSPLEPCTPSLGQEREGKFFHVLPSGVATELIACVRD